MKIAGLQKLTLLDFPGKIACIIFTQGCNFACGYCHNAEMIPIVDDAPHLLDERKVKNFLLSRVGLIDGVVISGGEPTLQKDLLEALFDIKNLGYAIKLDTNGSNPDILKKILQQQLVNYVALDIKTSLHKYKNLVKNEIGEKLMKTIEILRASEIDHEYRSTILPHCHDEEDIHAMGKLIQGAKKWYLQSFRPQKTLLRSFQNMTSFTSVELQRMKRIAEGYAKHVEIRQ